MISILLQEHLSLYSLLWTYCTNSRSRGLLFNGICTNAPTHNPRPHTGFPMSAHLSRPSLFRGHQQSLVWVWVWNWDWVHNSPHHHPLTHYPLPPRLIVRSSQTSSHKPRLVVPFSPSAQLCNRSCSNKQQRPKELNSE
jgi:hypothetical protein